MQKVRTTTWLAQIAVVLMLMASSMASGANGFLSWNSPLGENPAEAVCCQAATSLSGESHRGCGDLSQQDAAGLFVAPATSTGSRIFQSEVSVMSPDQVQRALRSGGYTGNTTWAYSIHDHHFYPRWLGGQEAGPHLRVRGFEHITDLEPALFAHMQRAIPAITERTAGHIQQLIARGRVTQDQITRALVSFYRSRYPSLSEDAILAALRQGL